MPFEKIIGQDIAVRALQNIISEDQVRGSYLFSGPDGIGKRTTALEFAKAVNCEYREGKGKTPLSKSDICKCISCKKIDSLNHPDIFLIYPDGASSSIKIDTVREIIYQVSLKPYESEKRIFIIDNAESMTEEAQNAILKLLEEPPKNHVFILTTSNMSGLYPTIISRCRVLRFYSLSQGQIEGFLKERGIEEREVALFSHMAMGSIGRAKSFKEGNIIERRDQVINDFFLRRSVLLREKLLAEEISGDIEEKLFILLCWHRDILVASFTQEKDSLLNIDRFEEICNYAKEFSKEKLEMDILNIMKTIEYIGENVNPKIALFNMAVGLSQR